MRNGEAPLLRVREAAPLLGISIFRPLYQLANAWLDNWRPGRDAGGSPGPPHLDPPSGDRPPAAVGDNGHSPIAG